MLDLTYLNTLINTVVSEFRTDVPIVADAFSTFADRCGIGESFRLYDIPDSENVKNPFSTYAEDLIYCSYGESSSQLLSRHKIRGISSLAASVNGFRIELPDSVPCDPLCLENLYYYVLPNKRYRFSMGLMRLGEVTSSPSYSITSDKGEQYQFYRNEQMPSEIAINSPYYFTKGFIEGMTALVSSLSEVKRHPDSATTPDEIAAFRLGAFYAEAFLPKLTYPHERIFIRSNVYYYTPAQYADGSPDIASIQYVMALLSGMSKKISVVPLRTDVENVLSSFEGYSFTQTVEQLPALSENAFLVITPIILPLTLLGNMSKAN